LTCFPEINKTDSAEAEKRKYMKAKNQTRTLRSHGGIVKMSLILVAAVSLFAVSGFADTNYNNFTGYSDYWHPFGNPDTSTYGEVFTSPSNGDNNLTTFSFYMGTPVVSGDIITGAYIATWNGTMAGTLLYSGGPIDYDNNGDEEITVNTGGLSLASNTQYVMFLSVSNYSGLSVGQANVSQGTSIAGLNGFVYNNNGGDFGSLFTTPWGGPLLPDWAVNLNFTNVPEPATLGLIVMGGLGLVGALRRRR
jgi:hypothetical protein